MENDVADLRNGAADKGKDFPSQRYDALNHGKDFPGSIHRLENLRNPAGDKGNASLDKAFDFPDEGNRAVSVIGTSFDSLLDVLE